MGQIIKRRRVMGGDIISPSLYVDMGLPSGRLWAKRNIDVTQPDGFAASEYQYACSYFSWGNVDGHNPSGQSSFYPWDWGGVNAQSPYYQGQVYGNTIGSLLTNNIPNSVTYDAAIRNLGVHWRMPTVNEYLELFNASYIKYINEDGTEVAGVDKRVYVNGILGIYISSRINGERLFFPVTGRGNGNALEYSMDNGYYWSSTYTNERNSRVMSYGSSGLTPNNNGSRYFGCAIRPIRL